VPIRLDHLVILVQDLEEAITDYGRLGFRVTPGGEHADGLTRNALVPFRDGTYLELVAFIEPEDGRDNVWGWQRFLPHEGLIDYCATSEDLQEDVARLRGLGLEVEDLGEGGRRLPDGREIRWRSASIRQEGRVLPFLIEDVTSRQMRVPGGPAADHPNGATGIPRLEISTPEAARTPRVRGLRDLPGGTLRRKEGRPVGDRPLGGRARLRRGTRPDALPWGPARAHTRVRGLKANRPICCIIRRNGADYREGRT
jgi:catechol 2,3-dioxygenase-like lactoylglutathione lyase family enzyme